jgi:hypothetical protein
MPNRFDFSGLMSISQAGETLGLKSCLLLPRYTTASETGALTVAGQWRSFTAFPNILAIAMISELQHRAAATMPWKRLP